jgi:hypothetical protein
MSGRADAGGGRRRHARGPAEATANSNARHWAGGLNKFKLMRGPGDNYFFRLGPVRRAWPTTPAATM